MMEALEEKYEIIHGEEFMLAAASLPHLDIQRNLTRIIDTYLRGKRCKLYYEAMVVFDDNNKFQPDLLVVCDRNKLKGNHIEGAPDFIVEILSPATYFRDFGVKKDIYEKNGVQEYWIINPSDKTVMVYLLKKGKYELDNVYHSYNEEEWDALTEKEKSQQKLSLKLSLYDDLEIDVKEIFED